MVRNVPNEVGFSTYALSKPRVSLAANRAYWYARLPMSFEDSQPLASIAKKIILSHSAI